MNDPMVEMLRRELATSDLHDRLSNAALNLAAEYGHGFNDCPEKLEIEYT